MITPITPVKHAIANIAQGRKYGVYSWGDSTASWGDSLATWGNLSIVPITSSKHSITPINTPKN